MAAPFGWPLAGGGSHWRRQLTAGGSSPVAMLPAVYRAWVFLHLVGMAGFLATHGVSMVAVFQLRAADGDRDGMLAICESSKRMNRPMYLFAMLLVLGGVAAGIEATSFDEVWLWGSLVILVATMAAMSFTATPYMKKVREGCTRWADGTYTLSDEELLAAVNGPMTVVITAIGGLALLIILYLMVFKPGA